MRQQWNEDIPTECKWQRQVRMIYHIYGYNTRLSYIPAYMQWLIKTDTPSEKYLKRPDQ